MDLTVMEAVAATTAVVLWVSVIDIAILVNVSSWVTIKWLLKIAKEM